MGQGCHSPARVHETNNDGDSVVFDNLSVHGVAAKVPCGAQRLPSFFYHAASKRGNPENMYKGPNTYSIAQRIPNFGINPSSASKSETTMAFTPLRACFHATEEAFVCRIYSIDILQRPPSPSQLCRHVRWLAHKTSSPTCRNMPPSFSLKPVRHSQGLRRNSSSTKTIGRTVSYACCGVEGTRSVEGRLEGPGEHAQRSRCGAIPAHTRPTASDRNAQSPGSRAAQAVGSSRD